MHQREIGRHTASFATGLRAALREDPDVILVGELRDLETIRLALTAAETGHLVQRQLDTLEQRQFMYTGQAWPGQLVQWQIQPEESGEREGNGQQEMRAWHTSLAMSLPALGGLAARLRMVGNQVQLTFDTDNPEAAALIVALANRR